MTYIVYCRFYSHKLKIEVVAGSAIEAKKMVQNSLEIIKIIKEAPSTTDEMFTNLMDALGMKG